MSLQMGWILGQSCCRALKESTPVLIRLAPTFSISQAAFPLTAQPARVCLSSVRTHGIVPGISRQEGCSDSGNLSSLLIGCPFPIHRFRYTKREMQVKIRTYSCSNVAAPPPVVRTRPAWNALVSLQTTGWLPVRMHRSTLPNRFLEPSFQSFRQQLLSSAHYATSAGPGSWGPGKIRKSEKSKYWKKNRHLPVHRLAGNVTTEASGTKPAKEAIVHKESLVIVESPAKAKTIEKYLGDKYLVLASYGHVRDLASKSGSVLPDEDFQMVWEVPAQAQQHLNSMKAALATVNTLILASDPDREGEAIAWHVLEMLRTEGALRSDHVVKRVVFHEITKSAVTRAMDSPRCLSDSLVGAYLARRALDYLIGFDLSPVLWRKLPGSKSAGRVQSAALRLVSERETEIEEFRPQEYWTVEAEVLLSASKGISEVQNAPRSARLTRFMGEKVGQFTLTAETAPAAAKRVAESNLLASSIKNSVIRRTSPAPYITSTLQQDASNKLSFSASRTMAIAQQLYEGVSLEHDELTGLITYMRTDSVQLATEAVQSIRSFIGERYGEDYVPATQRVYQSRAKNAQEAHEAIRPTDIFRLPSSLVHVLDDDALQLYSLIWCRALTCQMEQALYNQVSVVIVNEDKSVELRCSGSVMSFPGFHAVFKDKDALGAGRDWSIFQEEEDVGRNILPLCEAGDRVELKQVDPNQHFTEPPPRYSEGSLVKKLEELGIGRPSTYASTLKTLQARAYVTIVARRITPEIRGRMVSAFLSKYFGHFVDYDFTANLESQLDEISAGRLEWKAFLANFWPPFHGAVTETMKVPMKEVVEMLESRFMEQLYPDKKDCPRCQKGRISMKLSRYGAGYFLGCSRYPECQFKKSMPKGEDDSSDEEEDSPFDEVLGVDPTSGLEVLIRKGPFGRYVQLGQSTKKEKPKRGTIPQNWEQITLESALKILSYPLELGRHPDDGAVITLGLGRFGRIVRHKGRIVKVPEDLADEDLTVKKAAQLFTSPQVKRPGRLSQRDALTRYQKNVEVKGTEKLGEVTEGSDEAISEVPRLAASMSAVSNERVARLEAKGRLNSSKTDSVYPDIERGVVQPKVRERNGKTVDAGSVSSLSDDKGAKPGRGRPKGSRNRTNKTDVVRVVSINGGAQRCRGRPKGSRNRTTERGEDVKGRQHEQRPVKRTTGEAAPSPVASELANSSQPRRRGRPGDFGRKEKGVVDLASLKAKGVSYTNGNEDPQPTHKQKRRGRPSREASYAMNF